MSVLGDLGVGSTDLEIWTNMGRVGIRLARVGPAEPRPQDWEDWSEPSRPSLTLGWAGLGWDHWAPLWPNEAIYRQLASRQRSRATRHCLYHGGQPPVCTSQVYLWAGTGVAVPVYVSQWASRCGGF